MLLHTTPSKNISDILMSIPRRMSTRQYPCSNTTAGRYRSRRHQPRLPFNNNRCCGPDAAIEASHSALDRVVNFVVPHYSSSRQYHVFAIILFRHTRTQSPRKLLYDIILQERAKRRLYFLVMTITHIERVKTTQFRLQLT